ncbi:hypothetical protein [Pseudoalteromonas translucida]|uniref:Orphan protein n=1 Tax=Pseudoalteromonas translucida (strain TAC 125) TaxID=326442 RepID=Q3IGM8_PSET1|nr:hypothetical protein [Pseudoalteromonas translucida]CAI86631.1 putative orphan protein [Pseudoalteromonas translucida]
MTSKIIDFIILDEEQNPLLDAEGFPTLLQAPIGKDIGQLISMGKISHIEQFAQLASDIEQHEWASEYLEYLRLVKWIEAKNSNLPDPVANADGTVTYPEPIPPPREPIHPKIRTVEQVLEPFAKALAKLKGITFKGVNVALTETNQNGLSALKSALDLAKEFGAEAQFFPINFNAETSSSIEVVTLDDEIEFKEFGLQFILARKTFFE